jgi:hypothetical protein
LALSATLLLLTLTAQSLSSAMSSTADECACQLANLLSKHTQSNMLYDTKLTMHPAAAHADCAIAQQRYVQHCRGMRLPAGKPVEPQAQEK